MLELPIGDNPFAMLDEPGLLANNLGEPDIKGTADIKVK